MTINKIQDNAAEIQLPVNHQHKTSPAYPAGQISFGKIPVFIFYENPELRSECHANYEIKSGQLNKTKWVIKRNSLL